MDAAPDRWEHGSDFHWMPPAPGEACDAPWGPASVAHATGRGALAALVELGRRRGWRRLHVPSYLCPKVVAAAASRIDVASHPDRPDATGPDTSRIAWRPGDALLVVDTLGLRRPPEPGAVPDGVEVIEDHTHDPWSPWALRSKADYCLASLRKTLPLPDGALTWSPRGHELPEAPAEDPEAARAAGLRLAAMLLKGSYLAGRPVEKQAWRELAIEGERGLGGCRPAAVSHLSRLVLPALPTRTWRQRRRDNHALLARKLDGLDGVACLRPAGDSCPFVLTLLAADEATRDRLRAGLVARRVYPAVLWDLQDGAVVAPRPEDVAWSRRVLCLHCDARYDAGDMGRVATAVRDVLAEAAR